MTAHILGSPSTDKNHQLRWANQQYSAKELRLQHWQNQKDAGLDWVAMGSLVSCDQDLSVAAVSEIKSPALSIEQEVYLFGQALFNEVSEAKEAGFNPRPTLLGPLTFVWYSDAENESKLALVERLLPVYAQLLSKLAELGCEWVQIDEPALILDLPQQWKQAYESAYNRLQGQSINVLLATYGGELKSNLQLACRLPVAGLHVDLLAAPEQLTGILDVLPVYKVLSVGVVNGRTILRTNLRASLALLAVAHQRLGSRLWIGTNCSLPPHPLKDRPVDFDLTTAERRDITSGLDFSKQKLQDVKLLSRALAEGPLVADISAAIFASQQAYKRQSHSVWPS